MATIQDLQRPVVTAEEPEEGRSLHGMWALIRRLHFYAGVLVAPFIAVAALTGLAFTVTPQLDQFLYGEQLRVEAVGTSTVPLVDQVRTARLAHPEGSLASVLVPEDPAATTRVVLTVADLPEDRQLTVFVDPYSGEVRGELTTWFGSTPATTLLDDVHRNLLLGEPGRIYSELAASWLWVVVLGGLTLWLFRRKQYRGKGLRRVLLPDLSARRVRRTRSFHAATGVWITVGLLFLSATGLTWSTYAGARFGSALTALGHDRPVLDAALPGAAGAAAGGEEAHHDEGGPSATGLPAGLSIDEVVTTARGVEVDGRVDVTPPADAESGWVVSQAEDRWPVGRDQAAIDPETGEVLDVVRWSEHPPLRQLSTYGVLAHMGLLFGPVNQLLLALLALGLLALIVWGYRSWWQRRPTRGDARRLAGAAPRRGAWREVPRPALVAVVVVVAFVGWALPLLGISLLAFLVMDALIGVRQRRALGTQGAPPQMADTA